MHWARDAQEANAIVCELVSSHGADEVVKSKSLTTEECKLNEALAERGIRAWETDLAQLIIQLSGDTPSHILVPAIHRNREEIRELFSRTLDGAPADLTDDPRELAETARRHLRRLFLAARVGISGANFAVAQTGTVAIVESEGNARMCTTLPEVLITVMGIEKLIPTWQDFEVYLQLLPRSSTAERMNPYTSLWTGVTPGDGPQEFHLVLVDNGRTNVLADEIGRQTLNCIRCSACLNVCPVYERTGGHAYGSTYPGPIGAILTPLHEWHARRRARSRTPRACAAPATRSARSRSTSRKCSCISGTRSCRLPAAAKSRPSPERLAMRGLARIFSSRRLYEAAQRAGRLGQWPLARHGKIEHLPGPLSGWTSARDLPPLPQQSFRDWWRERQP